MKKQLTTLAVDKKIANLIHKYCVFHNLKMQDFMEELIIEKLKPFEEQLNKINQYNFIKK